MRDQVRRMWVNQPSSKQVHHELHETNVLAAYKGEGTYIIYFLSGDSFVSQEIADTALSLGWKEKPI